MALGAPLRLAALLGARCRDSRLCLPALPCCQNPFSSKTLCKACRREIDSRRVVFFSNLHFRPCLKRVLWYPKWSLISLPSCYLGKLLSARHVPPSHTGHSCLSPCSQEGLDNPKRVCNDFLLPQIRSRCPFHLIITFFPPSLQGRNVSRSPFLPFPPQPYVWARQNHVSSCRCVRFSSVFSHHLSKYLLCYQSH